MEFMQKRCPVSRLLLDLAKWAYQFNLLYCWSEQQACIWPKSQSFGLFFHLNPVFLFHADKLLGVAKRLNSFKVFRLSGWVLVWQCRCWWGEVWAGWRDVSGLLLGDTGCSLSSSNKWVVWGIEIPHEGLEVVTEFREGSSPWGKSSRLHCVVEHPDEVWCSSCTIPLQLTMWWWTWTPCFTFTLVSSEMVTGDLFICQ